MKARNMWGEWTEFVEICEECREFGVNVGAKTWSDGRRLCAFCKADAVVRSVSNGGRVK